MKRSISILLVVALAAAGVSAFVLLRAKRIDSVRYDLARPTASFELPTGLTEISGLTAIDEHTVACVQDEVGAVFFIDVRKGKVVRRVPFGKDGDYEGLANVDGALWVLRSDGRLLELEAAGDAFATRRRIKPKLDDREFEGLCFDPFERVLLVAMKERSKGSKSDRAKRRVYRFDPVNGERVKGSALKTTVDGIVEDAERAGIVLPNKVSNKGERRVDLKARFSSVAVQPQSRELFLLSAADRAVLVFTRDSELVAAHLLDGEQMPQPEGMTFLANGGMVIASEGGEGRGPARVQVYAPRRR